eukprot:1960710-Alexandrium_andersonii.AAC.1
MQVGKAAHATRTLPTCLASSCARELVLRVPRSSCDTAPCATEAMWRIFHALGEDPSAVKRA